MTMRFGSETTGFTWSLAVAAAKSLSFLDIFKWEWKSDILERGRDNLEGEKVALEDERDSLGSRRVAFMDFLERQTEGTRIPDSQEEGARGGELLSASRSRARQIT